MGDDPGFWRLAQGHLKVVHQGGVEQKQRPQQDTEAKECNDWAVTGALGKRSLLETEKIRGSILPRPSRVTATCRHLTPVGRTPPQTSDLHRGHTSRIFSQVINRN